MVTSLKLSLIGSEDLAESANDSSRLIVSRHARLLSPILRAIGVLSAALVHKFKVVRNNAERLTPQLHAGADGLILNLYDFFHTFFGQFNDVW